MTTVFRGWWQVAAAFVVQAVSSASVFTAYSLVAVPFKIEFAPSNMVLMLGITVTVLATGILSPPVGAAVDRLSMRKLMLIGGCFLTVGFALLSFATSMNQVIVIYLLFMSVSSLLIGPLAASALLARWFTRRRGMAMGIAASGTAIGGMIIPPLLQGLLDGFDWRMALRIYSVIVFVVTVPTVFFLVINRPSDCNQFPDGDDEAEATIKAAGFVPMPAEQSVNLMRSKNFWFIALSLGTIFCGSTALVSNLVPVINEIGFDAAKAALLLSIFSFANLAGKLLCAAVADRVDFRVGLLTIMGGLAVGMLCFSAAQSFIILAVSAIIIGTSAGGASPLWSVILARIYGPERIGRVMGQMTLIIMPFTLFAPPLFGWTFDQTNSYDNALIGYTILLGCMAVLTLRIRQPAVTAAPVPNVG